MSPRCKFRVRSHAPAGGEGVTALLGAVVYFRRVTLGLRGVMFNSKLCSVCRVVEGGLPICDVVDRIFANSWIRTLVCLATIPASGFHLRIVHWDDDWEDLPQYD